MASTLQITYLHHSGFAVRIGDTLLVFDDARGPSAEGQSLEAGYVSAPLVKAHRQSIFFVSHAHSDHFNPAIYTLQPAGDVHYVLGFDVPLPHAGRRMHPGERLSLCGAEIEAYGSTDEGVSFLVRLGGWTLFHAGDLNLWHWRDESTPKEIEQAEKDFTEAVAPLIGQPIDFAFFPLDPRLGSLYDAGALYFLMHVKPAVMLPMHWWTRSDAAIDFARRNRTKHVEIVALTRPGEAIRAQKQADGTLVIDL